MSNFGTDVQKLVQSFIFQLNLIYFLYIIQTFNIFSGYIQFHSPVSCTFKSIGLLPSSVQLLSRVRLFATP